MSRFIIAFIILGSYLLIDIYVFYGMDQVFEGTVTYRIGYVLLSLVVLSSFVKIFSDLRSNFGIRSPITNFLIGFAFAVFVTKLIYTFLMMFQDAVRIIFSASNLVAKIFGTNIWHGLIPPRSVEVSTFFALLVVIPFLVMIYGITRGKYSFKVTEVPLFLNGLPRAFEGFTIAQISDIHAGSFDSLQQVSKGVDLVNSLNADTILFTGDLVNSHKDEIDPYMEIFKKLSAPYGMYSVTGNHDYYGAYRYGDPVEKHDYWESFFKKHEEIGFEILNNRSVEIQKDGERLIIAGVENWGAGPFPKRGSLRKALAAVPNEDITILMSHDPTHWEHHILPHDKHVHLTLSGHTHAMQFGINLWGFKWSPVQYKYKQWMGMYEIEGQYLYVNRGFGFLGFPGRVGMSPEITLFTLKNRENQN